MKTKGVARSGKVFVMRELCDTCIFRPGNLMQLAADRVAQMERDAVRSDSCIPCHKTTYGQDKRGEAICRGYFERNKRNVYPLRLAIAFQAIEEQ